MKGDSTLSDYIYTYSKIKFYPLEPVKKDILIIDIAHALSLMTRANGHFKHFYSVAQHSINCYKEAKSREYSTKVQLGCLLHDASESYISDLTRPVKKNLSEYFVIEKNYKKLFMNVLVLVIYLMKSKSRLEILMILYFILSSKS